MIPRLHTVREIRATFESSTFGALPELIDLYADDPRAGVVQALRSARARLAREAAEETRLEGLYALESRLRSTGLAVVAGVDEVGRGALAGPLTAGACVLPASPRIHGLNDSKLLSPKRREELAVRIRAVAAGCAVAHVPAADVDRMGVTRALKRAMREALAALPDVPDHVVLDGLPLNVTLSESAVVKGDRRVAAIAAASIVAKVERDALMRAYDETYPEYGFAVNKGYGTAEHMDCIRRLGPSPIHRLTFCHLEPSAPGSTPDTLF